MAQANSDNSITSRRRFLTVAAAASSSCIVTLPPLFQFNWKVNE